MAGWELEGDTDRIIEDRLRSISDNALGALGLLDPQPEHLLAPVGADTQGQVDGLVSDGAFIADLQALLVEIEDGVHRLQRALLPLLDLRQYLVGDGGDQVGRDLQAVQFLQVALDLSHAHAACIHADHVVVEAGQPALVLGDQLRLEGGLPAARNVQFQFAVGREDGLWAGAIAVIATPAFPLPQQPDGASVRRPACARPTAS